MPRISAIQRFASLLPRLALAAVAVAGAAAPLSAQAQTLYYWSGGGANTSLVTSGNFQNSPTSGTNSTPTSSDQTQLVFGSRQATLTTGSNATAGFNVSALIFSNSTSQSYTLAGAQLEFKKVGSTNPLIQQNSAQNHTISTGIKLSEPLTLGGNGSGLMTLTGAWEAGTKGLTKSGSSSYFLDVASITNSGAVGINGGVLALRSGTTLTGGAMSFNGGVLAATGTFSRSLGTGDTSVNLSGASGGGFAAYSTLGSGTFTVSTGLGTWGSGQSLANNAPLILGGAIANGEVRLSGTLNLGTSGSTRTIRLVDNANSAADKAVMAGVISGAANLQITGTGHLTLSAANTYTGTTTVSGGTLAFGANNVLSNSTPVNISGGTLDSGTFTDTIARLAFTGAGGTLRLSPTLSQTSARITATGTVNLTGTSGLDLSGASFDQTQGLYRLVSGGTLTGTFNSVTGLDSNYLLRYGTVNANSVDAQRKADQAATFTMTAAASRVLVDSVVRLSGTIANSSPANSSALTLGLSSTGQLTVSNFTTGSVTAGSNLAVSGSIAAGSVAGSRTWTVVNTDASAIRTTSTATGTIDVVNQRVFTTSTSTLALGFIHQGGSIGSPTVVVTSTGLNAATANATLGSFTGGPGGFGLALTSGSAQFNGAAASQQATYTLSGSAGSLGAISGTFSSAVTGEFGGIPNVAVAVSGNVYSGQSTWATNGGGNWGTFSGTGANAFGTNWGANQGSPGLDAAFADTDSATFGAVLTGGTAAINTAGATVSLRSLAFNNAQGSYELYQTGGSGPLTLRATGTTAGISVVAGSHAIHTDVTLGANTVVDVASGAQLTFHDVISGSAAFDLTKTGAGTLVFDGNGTYAGNTTISAGLVRLVSGVTPLGTGTVTVASGATLDFNFLKLDNPLNVLSGGILLNTGTSQTTDVSDNVVFAGTTDGFVTVQPGGNADFQGDVNATVTIGSGAGAVFEASASGAPTVTVNSGGAVIVAGTAAGSWTIAGTGTFAGPLVGSLGVSDGGVVAFLGSNAPSSSFNVAAGGLVTTGSASTIGGQLHVSGSAVIGGAVAADADVIVESGGTVKLVNGAAFAQTSLTNDGVLVFDRSEALLLATAISGTGRLEKTGSGVLELTGANTFTGQTALNQGTLLLNGSLASDVAALADATLGGSGSIAGTISGAGLVSPGNSPGILEAGRFDPTGGLDAAFEFTAFAPNYAVSGTGALNDVLRLTDSSPFVANLGTGNVVDVYFNVASLEYNDSFEGGFFTTQSPEALLAAVQNAQYQFWFRTSGAGQRIFEGVNYNPLSYAYSDFSGARVETRAVTADFGNGPVEGAVMNFITVPEPGAMIPAGIGILALVWRMRPGMRRRTMA